MIMELFPIKGIYKVSAIIVVALVVSLLLLGCEKNEGDKKKTVDISKTTKVENPDNNSDSIINKKKSLSLYSNFGILNCPNIY